MPQPWLLHPATVHFPIALLTAGFAGACAAAWARKEPARGDAVSWLLWLGTASACLATALGYWAKNTAPHVPPAWHVLGEHESLGYWSAGVFTLLSLWRAYLPRKFPGLFLAFWLGATLLLLDTAWHGGKLVYVYNMGTAASGE